MGLLERVTATFVKQSREILGENLVGVYLHGSAAMGCLNEKKSDIDLLTVVDMALPDAIKRRYMDMVVGLNADLFLCASAQHDSQKEKRKDQKKFFHCESLLREKGEAVSARRAVPSGKGGKAAEGASTGYFPCRRMSSPTKNSISQLPSRRETIFSV